MLFSSATHHSYLSPSHFVNAHPYILFYLQKCCVSLRFLLQSLNLFHRITNAFSLLPLYPVGVLEQGSNWILFHQIFPVS